MQSSTTMRRTFNLNVSISAAGGIIAMAILVFAVNPGSQAPQLLPFLLWFSLSGAAMLVALRFVFAKAAALFSVDVHALQDDHDACASYLGKLGETPLSMLVTVILLFLPYVAASSVFVGRILGYEFIRYFLLGALFLAAGMLGAAFVYVISDRLILRFMLDHDITAWSKAFTVKRQARKTLIIPLFMLFMTFIFTYGYMMMLSMNIPDEQSLHGAELALFFSSRLFLLFVPYVVIVSALMFIWNRNTSSLYGSVVKQMNDIVTGDKDLTSRIRIGSVDEIAMISGLINSFSEMLCGSLRNLKNLYGRFDTIQQTLFASIESSSGRVKEIARRIDATMEVIAKEDESVRHSIETGNRVLSYIGEIVKSVNEQGLSVSGSADRIRSMVGSISSVSDATGGALERVKILTDMFEAGENNVTSTIGSVQAVVELSRNLMEINNLVATIASQTNLLAMNAAIEAAHAGEHGKGFSVVADEIRKLAETTAANTKKSRDNLKSILREIENAMAVSQATGLTFQELKTVLVDLTSLMRQVGTSMAEQDRANKDVLDSLTDTVSLTGKLQENSTRLDGESTAMLSTLKTLSEDSTRSLANAREMERMNSEVLGAIEELTVLSVETRELNRKATALLGEFRIDGNGR